MKINDSVIWAIPEFVECNDGPTWIGIEGLECYKFLESGIRIGIMINFRGDVFINGLLVPELGEHFV